MEARRALEDLRAAHGVFAVERIGIGRADAPERAFLQVQFGRARYDGTPEIGRVVAILFQEAEAVAGKLGDILQNEIRAF